MNDKLLQLRAFLAERNAMTLATIGPDGAPHATDVYYAETGDLELYFVSGPGSQHSRNLAHDPRVAATVHADSTRWRDIRGVQLEGICSRVTDEERGAAWARYTAKFSFVLADAALAGALQKVDMYCVTSHWLRWIDNAAGLGHNLEWRLEVGDWKLEVRSWKLGAE
jgi:uncharacterized protein YhbP (UPF0306 family)